MQTKVNGKTAGRFNSDSDQYAKRRSISGSQAIQPPIDAMDKSSAIHHPLRATIIHSRMHGVPSGRPENGIFFSDILYFMSFLVKSGTAPNSHDPLLLGFP